jgi:hypothetical protein
MSGESRRLPPPGQSTIPEAGHSATTHERWASRGSGCDRPAVPRIAGRAPSAAMCPSARESRTAATSAIDRRLGRQVVALPLKRSSGSADKEATSVGAYDWRRVWRALPASCIGRTLTEGARPPKRKRFTAWASATEHVSDGSSTRKEVPARAPGESPKSPIPGASFCAAHASTIRLPPRLTPSGSSGSSTWSGSRHHGQRTVFAGFLQPAGITTRLGVSTEQGTYWDGSSDDPDPLVVLTITRPGQPATQASVNVHLMAG